MESKRERGGEEQRRARKTKSSTHTRTSRRPKQAKNDNDALDWSIQASVTHNHGLNHPRSGPSAPDWKSRGQARKNEQGPLDCSIQSAKEPGRDRHPDWNIRREPRGQAAGLPGLERPGGCGRKSRTRSSSN